MKQCIKCGTQIFGKARKYCPTCKSEVHKQQMNKNYKDNKCKWLCENGKYKINRLQCEICGSLKICEHRNPNYQIELEIIEKEFNRLGLIFIPKYQLTKSDDPNYRKNRSKKYYDIKYKSLYYIKLDEGSLLIHLLYNIKTNYIGIRTKRSFYKKKKHLDT